MRLTTIKDFKEMLKQISTLEDVDIDIEGCDLNYDNLDDFMKDTSIDDYQLTNRYKRNIDINILAKSKIWIIIYCD